MRLPGFSAEIALYKSNKPYRSARAGRVLSTPGVVPQWPTDKEVSTVASCGLAWLLCVWLRDPRWCHWYNTNPRCNPCTPNCEEKCKPDPAVIDPNTGYGTRNCVDSHCVPYKIFCPL